MELDDVQKQRSLTLLYKNVTSFEVGSRPRALPASSHLLPPLPPPFHARSPSPHPHPPRTHRPSWSQPLLLCLTTSGLSPCR